MADAELTLWQGDLIPCPRRQLLGANKLAVDLRGCTVFFRVTKDDVTVFEKAAIIEGDPQLGVVRYEWQAGDTDRHGLFEGQWIVVRDDGRHMTLPGRRTNRLRINAGPASA